MPALKPTDFYATVLWLGSVKDSEADLTSAPLSKCRLPSQVMRPNFIQD